MLKSSHKIAVYMEGHIDSDYGKMGCGVVRYLANPIVGVIDNELAGKPIQDYMPTSKDVPILPSLTEAINIKTQTTHNFQGKTKASNLFDPIKFVSCSSFDHA